MTDPEWFARALATAPHRGTTDVDGVCVAYRVWGRAGAPGVVLVHGGAAHGGWWDHIGPLLGGTVVAIDLSGHGDSDRRPSYDVDLWAEEVLAVARAAGAGPRPVVVGHSMGGFVALHAAAAFGSELAGAVVVDSPLRAATPEDDATRANRAARPPKVYPTRDVAIARFRPIPDQPVLPYVHAHVAAGSVREVGGGWGWKFDPRIFDRPRFTQGHVGPVGCRVAALRGEHGILTGPDSEALVRRLGGAVPVVEIPDAGHHVMLDQPLALVTALRTLFAAWGPVR